MSGIVRRARFSFLPSDHAEINVIKPLIVNHFRPVGTPQSLCAPRLVLLHIVVIMIAKEKIVLKRLLT